MEKIKPIFPKHGMKVNEIFSNLDEIVSDIPSWHGESGIFRFGYAMTEPKKIALDVMSRFGYLNNNNIGVHTQNLQPNQTGSRHIEAELIDKFADLLNCSDDVDGYITSGGTESNIVGGWIGRNTLQSIGAKKVCFIVTELTHASVSKAANILGVDLKQVPLRDDYSMDPDGLMEKLVLLSENYDGFVLFISVGYYSTGKSDVVSDISAILNASQMSNIKTYVHVDACFGGFVLPFTNPEFVFDFRNDNVASIALDPHKMGLMPYSCGLFICRKNLMNSIRNIDNQTGVYDQTLIGSRSGVVPLALWALINSLGYSGYKQINKRCLKTKEYLLGELAMLNKKNYFISDPYVNNFAVSFHNGEAGLLPAFIENKYRIKPIRLPVFQDRKVDSYENFYHFYTMPHITKNMIDELITDCVPFIKK